MILCSQVARTSITAQPVAVGPLAGNFFSPAASHFFVSIARAPTE